MSNSESKAAKTARLLAKAAADEEIEATLHDLAKFALTKKVEAGDKQGSRSFLGLYGRDRGYGPGGTRAPATLEEVLAHFSTDELDALEVELSRFFPA